MMHRQNSDWSSDPASTTNASHSSIERIVWTDDNDNHRIHQKKTSFAWYWCFKCCIVGSLVAGIGLAIILTFWLTSKTAATETSPQVPVRQVRVRQALVQLAVRQALVQVQVRQALVQVQVRQAQVRVQEAQVPVQQALVQVPVRQALAQVQQAQVQQAQVPVRQVQVQQAPVHQRTTTTAATTASITSNTCTSGWTGVTILYHCTNCTTIHPYAYYSYTYVAIATLTRISFSFREDNGCFAIDTVSVRSTAAPTVELISNNDFETGSFSSWTYCNPNGASAAGKVYHSLFCVSYTLTPKSGSYFYYDGAVGNNDYLSQ
ncbi:unnamed protein product [Adineta steineri]|uniref:Uncharacterized protein n=1 Tax=Adineta steineri TaxID=433720 RepID=A0A819K5R8_9BILA|nr:unnamed protein product [Adineta steineri]CAF3940409.1 unnamed protein product [Adineta steineri]